MSKITELTALTTPATGDLLPIVDISDTTDSVNGTTKKITLASLKASGSDIDTGTDDVKFVTSKAMADSGVYQAGGTDVAIADGGTGAGTATAAFDALAPTTTEGDIIYHNGMDNVRLAKGTTKQSLKMNSGATAPEWGTNIEKLYISTTEVTFTDGNGGGGAGVEATLFTTTLPANTLGTNNAVRLKIFLRDVHLDTAASSFVFKINYGGSAILTVTAGAPAADITTNIAGYIEAYLIADGNVNAQKVSATGLFYANVSEENGDLTVLMDKISMWGNGASAVGSAIDQTLSVSMTMANNAANDAVVEWCIIEVIK